MIGFERQWVPWTLAVITPILICINLIKWFFNRVRNRDFSITRSTLIMIVINTIIVPFGMGVAIIYSLYKRKFKQQELTIESYEAQKATRSWLQMAQDFLVSSSKLGLLLVVICVVAYLINYTLWHIRWLIHFCTTAMAGTPQQGLDCPICSDELGSQELLQLKCGKSHLYHYECLKKHVEADGSNDRCLFCIKKISVQFPIKSE